MKALKISWMLVAILTSSLFFASCFREDNPVSEKEQSEAVFQKQLDEALAWAQVYGPSTQAVADAVALRHNGKATPINYKTRQSAERKCRTDNSKPFRRHQIGSHWVRRLRPSQAPDHRLRLLGRHHQSGIRPSSNRDTGEELSHVLCCKSKGHLPARAGRLALQRHPYRDRSGARTLTSLL